MARHPRLPGSPAVPRSAQPELLLGNALHLAPLLWGFICLQHAMHRGDPFPRCFGGPDQTALVRPPPATRQKLNPRKQTAASPCPELQCGYGLRGRSQTRFPGPARSLTGPCRPFDGPCRPQGGAYRQSLRSRPPGLFWHPGSGSPGLFIGGSLFSLFAVFQRTSAASWLHGARHSQ